MTAADPAAKPSRVSSVKVPGRASAPAADPVADAGFDDEQLIAGAPGFEDAPTVEGATDAGGVVTLTAAQMEQAIARAVSLARAADRAAAIAAQPQGVTEAELPDQSEVDPSTLTAMKLTKQGYVVPHNFGTPPSMVGRQL